MPKEPSARATLLKKWVKELGADVSYKAPIRVRKYDEMCPGLGLPPQPILTRWGSWIDAADFYSKHFDVIKAVVESLNLNDAATIRLSQEAFNNPNVAQQLAYIQANFSILSSSITKLEAQGLSLAQSFDILTKVKTELSNANGEIGQAIRSKLNRVLDNNPGISKLVDIATVLAGGYAKIETAPEMMAAMKYAPVTSCDVETLIFLGLQKHFGR